MDTLLKDVTYGSLMSFVPITFLSTKFDNTHEIEEISYTKLIRTIPITFAVIHTLFMILMRIFGINNFFIIGALISFIYSGLGRFGTGIPTKILKMKNPNMFHIGAFIVWSLVYGLYGTQFYKMCN